MNTYDVMVGASRRKFTAPVVDATGALVPIASAFVVLQGFSPDLPGLVFNHVGRMDWPSGMAIFEGIGNLVTSAQLGRKPHITAQCHVKYVDDEGTDYGPWFKVKFMAQPAELAALEGAGLILNDNNLSRYYDFREGVPTALRNTFAGAAATVAVPALRFKSAGAAIETNKLYEVALESAFLDTQPSAPGSTIMYFDFITAFFCQMQGSVVNRGLIDPTAFVAIELGSAGENVLPTSVAGSTPSGTIQLRQSLADPSKWSLFSFFGGLQVGATFNEQVDFVVPLLNSNGPGGTPNPDTREGHHVGLVYDPFRLRVDAWVDGVVRAGIDLKTKNPIWLWAPELTVAGVLAYSGVQIGATVLDAMWTAPKLHTLNMSTLGSGLV